MTDSSFIYQIHLPDSWWKSQGQHVDLNDKRKLLAQSVPAGEAQVHPRSVNPILCNDLFYQENLFNPETDCLLQPFPWQLALGQTGQVFENGDPFWPSLNLDYKEIKSLNAAEMLQNEMMERHIAKLSSLQENNLRPWGRFNVPSIAEVAWYFRGDCFFGELLEEEQETLDLLKFSLDMVICLFEKSKDWYRNPHDDRLFHVPMCFLPMTVSNQPRQTMFELDQELKSYLLSSRTRRYRIHLCSPLNNATSEYLQKLAPIDELEILDAHHTAQFIRERLQCDSIIELLPGNFFDKKDLELEDWVRDKGNFVSGCNLFEMDPPGHLDKVNYFLELLPPATP
ncbi:MAG: hypothetical protein HQM13_01730 [SAR324 cluster bacterium]|nr:hypothetical protein [SAR324 cluster bacterium]